MFTSGLNQRLPPSVLACLRTLLLKFSPGRESSLERSSSPPLPYALCLCFVEMFLQDDFPNIPKMWLICTMARLTSLTSPGDGTGLGSCSVAAHRGEYFEASHSLFRWRECNGSYYLFCLSNCFFPFFWLPFWGLWLIDESLGKQLEIASLALKRAVLHSGSELSHAMGERADSEWIACACLPQRALPACGKAGFPLHPGHGDEVASLQCGSAVVKPACCSEGNWEVSRRWQHWSASLTPGTLSRHSQVAASFDQEGSEVFGLLNL